MLQGGDQGNDRRDQKTLTAAELNTEPDREALLKDDQAKRFFDEVRSLRQDLDALKSGGKKEEKDAEPARAAEAEPAPAPEEKNPAGSEPAGKEPAEAQASIGTEPANATNAEAAKATNTEATNTEPAGTKSAKTAEKVTEKPTSEGTFADRYRQQMESQIHEVQEIKAEQTQQRASKAAKAAKKEAYRRQKAARNEAKREERRARAKQKQKERELRAEIRRKKRLADKSAELGGGVVNLHDTTVSTEIIPVANYSWWDLLGLTSRKERKAAATEEERQALLEEKEQIKEDARAAASHLSRVRSNQFHNSAVGKRIDALTSFCDRHKNPLLVILSLVLLVCVGAAGIINYCTAYEYSYNGHALGYVKSKDEVLQITDMVQEALTEDKDLQVIIDAKDDITFRRVSTLDRDVIPDTSEEVLRRMTYVGDLNVEAYGIYVNGKKAGSVRSKEVAAKVLKKIEDRYASDKKGTVIEKAEILEMVDVHLSNTSLRRVYPAEKMADILCTSGEKETIHTVVAGDTLHDIAKNYNTTEDRLLRDNEGVDPTQLEVGSTLLIRQNAPLLTVRMTERRTYTKVIEFKVKEKKTDEMYEGDEEIQQEGEDGSVDITERTVSINGEREQRDVLKRDVTKKAVPKIILVGTAERPPTVGDGKYIWPLAGGYTLTSGYGYRWGRLHAGIDLGTPVGNDVLAADGGTVIRAGYFGGYGYCIDIDHQNGQMTRYGHLNSILVSVGDEVYEGQHIAESGNTGRSTGAHLHFEIHSNGQSHDPLQDLP